MNLLIVDDNITVREMMKSLFSDLADQIHESANGEEAITSYAIHQQDWVLMDIEMPICDGLAATRRITERSPDARVIILTSHNSKVLRQAALDAGACAYVLKDDLTDLHRILKGDKGMGSAAGGGGFKQFSSQSTKHFYAVPVFQYRTHKFIDNVRGAKGRLMIEVD